MTLFDLLLLVVLITSIGFAVIRGAIKEFATLAAIALAGGVAWWLSKPVLGMLGQSGSFFGTIAVIGVLVVLAFIAIYFGFHMLMRRITLSGNPGIANRVVGGIFGGIRAYILIGLGFLGYSYYLDAEKWPDGVKNAALLPIATSSAAFFEQFGVDEAPATPEAKETQETASLSSGGYSSNDRGNLVELVATVTTTDEPSPEVIQSNDDIADLLTGDL